ncbi:MAG: glycogen synthase [Coriobacteriia bacterium]|nr:glycogen synthase [Coriobacteriia bacterium]
MKVLHAVSEASPFITTGGLGEVGGSLPAALASEGAEVCVFMPLYSAIDPSLVAEREHLFSFNVKVSWRDAHCSVETLKMGNIQYYFICNDYYFCRDGIYGHFDEAERYAFFCRAVLDCLPHLGFQPDIIHCHDWQTALIPILLRNGYRSDLFYYDIKTVFTIHNVKYQGVFSPTVMRDVIGLEPSDELWSSLEFFDAVNLVKAAIYYADRITTVSPSYVYEIQDPYYGEHLDGVLRDNSYKLSGILNGIDTQKYDPMNDPLIFVPFRSSLAKKAENKYQLQKLLGLPATRVEHAKKHTAFASVCPDAKNTNPLFLSVTGTSHAPLLAIVSRLVDQKGVDLLTHVFDEIMGLDVQLVVLGSGEYHYEQFFEEMLWRYPEKLAIYLGYDVQLAHRIYAAADMLLMPSRFEPCGVAQMIAMRYGTIPIVRETGGLRDTVLPYNEITGEGNGFSFANFNAHEFLYAIERAVDLYQNDEAAWKGLFDNARKTKFDWKRSAKKYLKLYHELG